MTEEVTDAITCDWRCVQCKFVYFDSVRPDKCDCGCGIFAMIAWKEPNTRSASNSPTTNGEVTDDAILNADGEWVAWARPPRAASDDMERATRRVVHELTLSAQQFHEYGLQHHDKALMATHDPHEAEQRQRKAQRNLDREAACRAALAQYVAALSTPTKASAVDDPETAKGGE